MGHFLQQLADRLRQGKGTNTTRTGPLNRPRRSHPAARRESGELDPMFGALQAHAERRYVDVDVLGSGQGPMICTTVAVTMTYLIVVPGTRVQVTLGLAGDVVAGGVDVYGSLRHRRVLVWLAPKICRDLAAEPVLMRLPASAVRDAQATLGYRLSGPGAARSPIEWLTARECVGWPDQLLGGESASPPVARQFASVGCGYCEY